MRRLPFQAFLSHDVYSAAKSVLFHLTEPLDEKKIRMLAFHKNKNVRAFPFSGALYITSVAQAPGNAKETYQMRLAALSSKKQKTKTKTKGKHKTEKNKTRKKTRNKTKINKRINETQKNEKRNTKNTKNENKKK